MKLSCPNASMSASDIEIGSQWWRASDGGRRLGVTVLSIDDIGNATVNAWPGVISVGDLLAYWTPVPE